MEPKFEHKTYRQAVDLVSALIARLQRETGVSREYIRDSFMRGSLEGESFLEPELQLQLSTIFGPRFIPQLLTFKPVPNLQESYLLKAINADMS
jgi:hypothetical protein